MLSHVVENPPVGNCYLNKLFINLKVKQMETKRKRRKVIMLPTENAENAIIVKNHSINIDEFYYNKGTVTQAYLNSINAKSYHLYIVSDDEIKENEKGQFYDFNYNRIVNIAKNINNDKHFNRRDIRKIIATTDKALTKLGVMNNYYSLPQPSKAFIEKYCKLGGIDEVDVEYQEELVEGVTFGLHGNDEPPTELVLKVSSHNEITIHAIKDSWNRKELESILFDFAEYITDNPKKYIENTEQWIKKNL